jgi:hypothetical protein
MESRPGNEKGRPEGRRGFADAFAAERHSICPFRALARRRGPIRSSGGPQTVRILPPEMAEVETMLQLGGQALLDAAEFVLLRNMLRRVIKPPNPFKDFWRD